MKIKLLIIATLFVAAGVYAAWDMVRTPPVLSAAPPATPSLPDLSFTALDGTRTALADLEGKTVILNVWATWCPPCVKEFPSLLALAAQRPDDLVLIALSVDARASDVEHFLARLPAAAHAQKDAPNVIIALDPDKAVSRGKLNIERYPETLIITPQRTLHRTIKGEMDWTSREVLEMLDASSLQP